MIATVIAAAAGSILAAIATVFLALLLERNYRRAHPATPNVLSSVAPPSPAHPENQAAETPADADRTQHTPALDSATPSPTSAGKRALMRRLIDETTGELRVSLLPAETEAESPYAAIFSGDEFSSAPLFTVPAVPAEPREWNEIAVDALRALAAMRHSASQYKSLAETLEASLYAARQEAEQQRDRADRLQALYVERTRQALHAGFTIVIDHAGKRGNHGQR